MGWARYLFPALASLVLALPVMVFGLVATDDGVFHVVSAAAVSEVVASGDLYPRWIPSLQNGHGSPFLLFYAPGVYLSYSAIDALLAPGGELPPFFGLAVVIALYSLVFAIGTAVVLRRYLSVEQAILGGVLASVAPYHYFVDIAQRGALPEFCAIAFLPWMLVSAQRMVAARDLAAAVPWAILGALAYAGTIYTHVLSGLMVIPVVALATVFESLRRGGSLRAHLSRLLGVGAASGLGAALAAPVLLPAVTLMDTASASAWFDHVDDAAAKMAFLRSRLAGEYRGVMNYVDPIGLALCAGLVLSGVLVAFRRERTTAALLLPFLLPALVSLALAMGLPAAAWRGDGVLVFVQFPFRYVHYLEFLSLLVVAIVLMPMVPMKLLRWGTVGIVVAMTTVAGAKLYVLHSRPLEALQRERLEVRWQASEYLPAELTDGKKAGDVADALILAEAGPFVEIDPAGTVSARQVASDAWHIDVETPVPAELRIRQYHFPGWSICGLPAGCSEPDLTTEAGTLAVTVPEGQHELRLTRVVTPPERQARWIAGAAVTALVAMFGAAMVSAVASRGRDIEDQNSVAP